MSTRAAQKEALSHVLDNVFKIAATHPLRSFLASESVESIFILTRYKEDQIVDKEFMDSNGITRTLPTATINQIMDLKRWFRHCESPSATEFMTLTAEAFDEFCLGATPPASPSRLSGGTAATPTVVSPSPSKEADLFKRSIKRSVAEYPELKLKSEYPEWRLDVDNLLFSHGISFLTDPDYEATTPDEIAFEAEANQFLAGALVRKITYTAGANICQAHRQDARKILALLHSKCTEGIYGTEQRDALKKKLQAQRFDPRTVKDGETFLEVWFKQLTMLERQMKNIDPDSKGVSDSEKREWLEVSIAQNEDGKLANMTCMTLEATQKKKLSFEEYFEYLTNVLRTRRQYRQHSNTRKVIPISLWTSSWLMRSPSKATVLPWTPSSPSQSLVTQDSTLHRWS